MTLSYDVRTPSHTARAAAIAALCGALTWASKSVVVGESEPALSANLVCCKGKVQSGPQVYVEMII